MKNKVKINKSKMATPLKASKRGWSPIKTSKITLLSDARFVRIYNPYVGVSRDLSIAK